MRNTVEYLRNREWSMGNGQCPECCGHPLEWIGHPCCSGAYLEKLGHTDECPWAKMLEEVGEKVLRQGSIFPECWRGKPPYRGAVITDAPITPQGRDCG